jgi:hypothetical protein
MTPEDALRAAARTIGQMPEASIQRKLAQLQEARKIRTQREALRQHVESESLELDEAAYQAALKHEEDGDLRAAARWYRMAAVNDFPGASLKLASVLSVLSALAAEHHARAESQAGPAMYEEAMEWASKAFAAGEVGASRLIGELDERLDRPAHAAQHGEAMATRLPPDGRTTGECGLGGLRKAVALDPAEMSRHCQSCASCQDELAPSLLAPGPFSR